MIENHYYHDHEHHQHYLHHLHSLHYSHHHHSEHLSLRVTDMVHAHHLNHHHLNHHHFSHHHFNHHLATNHMHPHDSARQHLPHLHIEHESFHPKSTSASPSHNGFASQLLHRLSLPETEKNLDFLDAWQRAEGGHAFNPFNTTQRMAGGRSINSVGVQRYSSMEEGLNATVTTLKNGYYGGILQALRHNDPQAAKRALLASLWGTHRGVYLNTDLT